MADTTEEIKPLNRFYTYLYRDEYGVPIYAGKGKENRAYAHFSLKFNTHLSRKLQKMIREGYNPQPEFICLNVDEEFAFFCEQELVNKYGRLDLKTGTLFNLTNGGEGGTGPKSLEHNRKVGLANKGKIRSDEFKKAVSLRNKGKIITLEMRQKYSKALKGKPWTQKRRNAQKQKSKLVVLNFDDLFDEL